MRVAASYVVWAMFGASIAARLITIPSFLAQGQWDEALEEFLKLSGAVSTAWLGLEKDWW